MIHSFGNDDNDNNNTRYTVQMMKTHTKQTQTKQTKHHRTSGWLMRRSGSSPSLILTTLVLGQLLLLSIHFSSPFSSSLSSSSSSSFVSGSPSIYRRVSSSSSSSSSSSDNQQSFSTAFQAISRRGQGRPAKLCGIQLVTKLGSLCNHCYKISNANRRFKIDLKRTPGQKRVLEGIRSKLEAAELADSEDVDGSSSMAEEDRDEERRRRKKRAIRFGAKKGRKSSVHYKCCAFGCTEIQLKSLCCKKSPN